MPQDEYFVVQSIYAGWALFSVAIVVAILTNALLFLSLRGTDRIK